MYANYTNVQDRVWAPSQASILTWQHWPHGSSFRVTKDKKVKGLWNLPLQLRNAAETRHVAGEPLHGGPKETWWEAVKVKPGLYGRHRDGGSARTMGYLLRKAANRYRLSPRERSQSAKL